MSRSAQQIAYEQAVERQADGSKASQERLLFLTRVLQPKVIAWDWRPVELLGLPDLPGSTVAHRRHEIATSAGQGAPPPYYVFEDAEVLGHGGFIVGGRAVDEFMFTGQPAWRTIGIAPVLAKEVPVRHVDAERGVVYVDPPVWNGPALDAGFWFGSPYALANFGHFVHDLLTQIIFLDAVKDSGVSPKFVVTAFHAPKFRYAMQEFLFQALIGPLDDIVFHRKNSLSIHRLYTGSPVFSLLGGGKAVVDRAALRHLSRRVRDAFAHVPRRDEGRRIYITRDDGVLARQMDNEPAVRAMLVERGFTPVTISHYPPAEVVALFSGAEIIAGVHGAGLMNMIFADPDRVRVIELDTVPSSWNSIMTFAKGMGVSFDRIPATPVPGDTLGRVDVAALTAALDRAENPSSVSP